MEVDKGEVVALIGANGAGKSTLIKILSGVYPEHTGSVMLEGRVLRLDSPQVARKLGIETVHQRIADGIVPGLTVAENLVFEELTQGSMGSYFSVARMLPRARAACELLDLGWRDQLLREDVFELGIADQQLLLLARALSHQPRLLILDEPTAALSAVEVARLFAIISMLKANGVGILFVSHRLGEVDAVADRLVVLRDGYVRAQQGQPFEWNVALHAMLGEEATVTQSGVHERRGSQVVLRFTGVRLLPGSIAQDLDIRAGEVAAVVGLLGAGKSELLRGAFGARRFPTGTMELDGAPYDPSSPADAIERKVFFAPEDRAAEALLPGWSIERTVSLPFLSWVSKRGVLRGAAESALGRQVIDALGVVASDASFPVESLSGGNQQRVVIGRWLAAKPRVLLLDEPFTGVDIGARAAIGHRLRAIAAEDAAVVFTTSDVDEALEIADRLIVLVDGVVRSDAYRSETSRTQIVSQMSEIS
jgi:simple sugar transport system ATP-binding protein